MGSPYLALWLIALFGLAVVAVYHDLAQPTWALAVPLALLAANVACAVATHPAFRTQGALLVFHLALIAIAALAAAGRLTYLKGTLELSAGQTFGGKLLTEERGPLHPGDPAQAAFTNLGFTVSYLPGLRRAQTLNRVAFPDAAGREREALIGDDTPLVLRGYRFYTTPNKGYAPEFVWRPAAGGAPVRGTIHLPSFPASLTRQTLEWMPPGAARPFVTTLEFDEPVVRLEEEWVLGQAAPKHSLQVRAGAEQAVLRPGESHRFAEGTLRYEGLRMWMGYALFYDRTIAWLLAACAIAVASLAWHFAAKFLRTSWQEERTA